MKIEQYEILSAIYANKEHTSALLTTSNRGVVAVSESWNGWVELVADFDIADFDFIGQQNEKRRAEIYTQLEEIDRKTIRPLRSGEKTRLQELELEADNLRAELYKLS